MKMGKFKEKVNQCFMSYANFIVFLVLSIITLVQFTSYRNISYEDLIRDTELKARALADLVSDFSEIGESSESSLNKKIEQKLKDEMQLISRNGYTIVKLKIYRLDALTNNWNQVFTINGSFNTVLSREEKGIAIVASRFFKNKKEIRFNGEGFIAEGTVDVNSRNRLAVEVDANSFFLQLVWAALILALILVSVVIILIIELSVTKKQSEKKFEIYRDVIHAVTQGKFMLVKDEELPRYIDGGEKLAEVNISKGEDVGLARQISKQAINNLFPQYDKTQKILLCVSEAATNVVKHAGTGLFIIKRVDDKIIRFIFKDRGPGMDFENLPSMLFYKGFSTTISLGSGFNIIYSFVDDMILSTSKRGTTVAFDIKCSCDYSQCELKPV